MGCFAATRRARAFCLVNVGHTILAGANPRSAAVRASSAAFSTRVSVVGGPQT
ncbi:hypothetical protein PF008_g30461 [Phytophthora fragariae]|uniref:Uncharacterized protein n=1 Tax=Phytophthora fragariae TaxID=53985 RepID=A0A6G0Q5K1_9STRA|nr:hypothetical protein PF008_g30461 [Phytophthora fragariae]